MLIRAFTKTGNSLIWVYLGVVHILTLTFERADDQNEMDVHFGDGNWTYRQLFLKVTNIARNAFKDLEFENILNLGYCYHKHDI